MGTISETGKKNVAPIFKRDKLKTLCQLDLDSKQNKDMLKNYIDK